MHLISRLSNAEALIVKVMSGCGLVHSWHIDCGLGGVTR